MSDLLTISIRRKLDKGDKIGTNEIRSLLAVVDALKKRVAELEAKQNTVKAEEVKAAQS